MKPNMIRGDNFRNEKERKLAEADDEVGHICSAFIIGYFTFLIT